MKFRDIPQFPQARWQVNVSWPYLEEHIKVHEEMGLDLLPDFQRAHVWTEAQRVQYVEYCLQGGEVGRNVTFNCPGWVRGALEGPYQIVDGKQRIESVRRFLSNDLVVFGHKFQDFTDRLRFSGVDFLWRVCELPTYKDVLRLYLNINAGGTPHTAEELQRVQALLDHEQEQEMP